MIHSFIHSSFINHYPSSSSSLFNYTLSLLAIIGIITTASVSSLESSCFSKYSGAPQGHQVIFHAKGPPLPPPPYISLLYIIYHISLLHPRWDEQCRDTMMTVPPQLTSSLPSFSYPASFRHPPPASSLKETHIPKMLVHFIVSVVYKSVPGFGLLHFGAVYELDVKIKTVFFWTRPTLILWFHRSARRCLCSFFQGTWAIYPMACHLWCN